jgi:hypothetical protein
MTLHKHHPKNNKDASRWTPGPVCHSREPRKGDSYFVQTCGRYLGETFTIRRVNRRSFYAYRSTTGPGDGKLVRRLVVEWEQWIDELFEMGFVFLNGAPVLPPLRLTPRPEIVLAGAENQRRFNEAMSEARRMLKGHCVGEPVHSRKELRFCVAAEPGLAATVTVPDDEKKRIRCSCAEHNAGWRGSRYPCRHILAVLISRSDMRHRILEFLL